MRAAMPVGLLAFVVAGSTPVSAQHILKSEPLFLAPYGVALVQNNACAAGKIMKVTGAIRGLRRKKVCVTIAAN